MLKQIAVAITAALVLAGAGAGAAGGADNQSGNDPVAQHRIHQHQGIGPFGPHHHHHGRP